MLLKRYIDVKIFLKNSRTSQKRYTEKSQVLKYETDIKGTWNMIKELITKRKARSSFPNKIIVDIEIKDSLLIAEKFFSIIFLLTLT